MPKKRKKRNRSQSDLLYQFRGLVLDEFQRQAVWYLRKDTSLLVCAPTGTGKTLIADYLVDMTLKAGGRLIYTAPIKALVNQKFQEFSRQFGRDQVGIVTGDVSENNNASLVVMTTEVLRNMLMQDRLPDGLGWVVFDEIHYLDHPERGTVWEEAILLLPKSVGILGLSATIPNATEIANWIERVHRPIAVVSHDQRAVPLQHLYFTGDNQPVTHRELVAHFASDEFDPKAGTIPVEDRYWERGWHQSFGSSHHLDLINYVIGQRLLPCLYFVFSRRGCEARAEQLARSVNFLKPQEKRAVEVTVRRTIQDRGYQSRRYPQLESAASPMVPGNWSAPRRPSSHCQGNRGRAPVPTAAAGTLRDGDLCRRCQYAGEVCLF